MRRSSGPSPTHRSSIAKSNPMKIHNCMRRPMHRRLGFAVTLLVLCSTAQCEKCPASLDSASHPPDLFTPTQAAPSKSSAVIVRPPPVLPDLKRDELADCSRGEPEPLLRTTALSNFQRQGPLTAYETARLDASTGVEIKQSGCASALEEITFTVASGQKKSAAEWLEHAAALIDRTPVNRAFEKSFRVLARALRDAAKSPYQFGDSIAISESESVTLSVSVGADAAKVLVTRTISL